jgi:uncharacterized SAM-dependent methyltransferase
MNTPPCTPVQKTKVEIIDIRSSTQEVSLLEKLEESLSATPPSFPSLLLWDEKGLQHFEAVTYSPEYYLTDCEIELLKKHSKEIAQEIAVDASGRSRSCSMRWKPNVKPCFTMLST